MEKRENAYSVPKIEVILLSENDIIVTSDNPIQEQEGEWTKN